MIDLLAELTAPVEPPRKSALHILLDKLDEEAATAIRGALASDVPAGVLSKRLHDRDWLISQDMIQRYRRELKA